MSHPNRVQPSMAPLTEPFWHAAAQQRLVVQRCAACGHWQHPPSPRCHSCGDRDRLGWEPVSGDATLVSWTQVFQGLVHGFKQSVPYLNLLVELDEQPGLMMISDTTGTPISGWEPHAGARMRVWFEEVGAFTLPQFHPVEGNK